MKSGTCPKCGGNEVHTGANVTFKRGAYGANSIPVSFWSVAPLDNYVCARCGYVESYVADPSKLRKIAQDWPRV